MHKLATLMQWIMYAVFLVLAYNHYVDGEREFATMYTMFVILHYIISWCDAVTTKELKVMDARLNGLSRRLFDLQDEVDKRDRMK